MKKAWSWIVPIVLSALARVAAAQALPVTDDIVQVLEALRSANFAPDFVCAMQSLPYPAEQDGYQEVESGVAPNTWVARFATRLGEKAKAEQRRQEIERLDFLASIGFLEAKDAVISRGFIETGLPAREYRLTVNGWLAGLGGCLFAGKVELLRALDYTESPPAPNGYRTIKVRTLVGVRNPPEWARSEAARRLFPALRQIREGAQRERTLYRDPQGRIDTADTYIGSLKHMQSEEQTAARQRITASLTIDGANRILESLPVKPGRSERQALPQACFELFPSHHAQAPSLFVRAADGAFALQVPKTMSGSGVEHALLFAQARAQRLADAGLARLESASDAAAAQLRIRLTPQIEALVAQHGTCLPAGESRIELMGIGHNMERFPRPRIYGRAQVVSQAPWTRSTPAFLWLPELHALLTSGVFFDVDVYQGPAGWQVERVRSFAPSWTLPRLDAIGYSPGWKGGYLRQKGVSASMPSVKTHALHVVSAYEGTPGAGPGSPKEIEVDVRPMQRPAIIVLAGHVPTRWRLRVAPGARIGAVLAFGYEPQTIEGLPEHVPLVSAASILRWPLTQTALGRIQPLRLSSSSPGAGSTVVILGKDGPVTTSPGATVVQRAPNEHIVVPHGVQITQKGAGEFQVKEFESVTASDPPSPEALAQIRALFGVAPATVGFRYTGSRFVVDGREGAVMDAGGKK
jgi:hypothetical protein